MKRVLAVVFAGFVLVCVAAGAAVAQSASPDPLAAAGTYVNAPQPWQWWFPVAGSPMQVKIDWLMQYVLWIMAGVVGFVAVLMIYVFVKFNAKKNPVASHLTHNTLVEVVWLVVPTILLAIIIIPSISLIYYEADDSNPYMTVTVTGHQWYWEYNYQSVSGLDYTSYMIPDDKIGAGQIRRLSVDHPLVLPIGKKIKFNITSADVLHGFYLPSLGVQRYAIPGTIVTSWTEIPKVGTYYGQCNQICGVNHDAMPIEIKAVSMDDYLAWVKMAQADYTMNDMAPNLMSSPPPANQFASLTVTK
jgi:cytochrome c oxidase subunit 2